MSRFKWADFNSIPGVSYVYDKANNYNYVGHIKTVDKRKLKGFHAMAVLNVVGQPATFENQFFTDKDEARRWIELMVRLNG